ncbi:MAG: DUF6507 family protein [Phycicoccus sp.]
MAGPGDAYDVVPDRVGSVAQAVDGGLDRLLVAYEDMAEPVAAASTAAGSSVIVTEALADVLTWLQERAAVMGAAVGSGLTGVADALDAYTRGDAEIAETIVSDMVSVLAEDPTAVVGGGG